MAAAAPWGIAPAAGSKSARAKLNLIIDDFHIQRVRDREIVDAPRGGMPKGPVAAGYSRTWYCDTTYREGRPVDRDATCPITPFHSRYRKWPCRFARHLRHRYAIPAQNATLAAMVAGQFASWTPPWPNRMPTKIPGRYNTLTTGRSHSALVMLTSQGTATTAMPISKATPLSRQRGYATMSALKGADSFHL
jgi:hypothetical protein